jgi:hypothetical protein
MVGQSRRADPTPLCRTLQLWQGLECCTNSISMKQVAVRCVCSRVLQFDTRLAVKALAVTQLLQSPDACSLPDRAPLLAAVLRA